MWWSEEYGVCAGKGAGYRSEKMASPQVDSLLNSVRSLWRYVK